MSWSISIVKVLTGFVDVYLVKVLTYYAMDQLCMSWSIITVKVLISYYAMDLRSMSSSIMAVPDGLGFVCLN